MTLLKQALQLLQDRKPGYELAAAYYEGEVGEFLPRALRRLQRNDYKVNFCRTVVDSVLNRLEVAAVLGMDDESTAALNKAWEQNELSLEADEIHRRALTYGDCYAIVWPDDDGEMLVSYNSPLNTVLVYDQENPRKKSYALKTWTAQRNGKPAIRANLYFADRTERYVADTADLQTTTQWTLLDTVENPFGEVPVFHFRTQRPFGRPEHLDAYGAQDMVTQIVSDHMYTMAYQAAPQRYALSGFGDNPEIDDFEEAGTDRDNMSALKNGPGELWYLKGVQTVGQFEPADPKAFLDPFDTYVQSIAALTSTPLHYLQRGVSMPSGESLRTAEAPLLKKVGDRQQSFAAAWRDLFRFVLRAEGIDADVQVEWASAESLDSLDFWDTILKKRNSGVPMRQVFAEAGYDTELVEKMLNWYEEERERFGGFIQRDPIVKVREAVEEPTTDGY